MKIGVVIATYGDLDEWAQRARRALDSAWAALQCAKAGFAVEWNHGQTLHEARNAGATKVGADCDRLIFLDADDTLHPGYIQAMGAAQEKNQFRSDVRDFIYRPITQGFHGDGTVEEPSMIPRRDLRTSNFIVIGAMCPTDLFFEVGGFDDYPILEDWALWRKMVAAGAEVVDVPEAIYRIHVRPGSRNTDPAHGQVYQRILRECPL